MALIGIVGKAGAGKSYLANYMVENREFIKTSFAHRLKKAVGAYFDIDPRELDREEIKSKIIPGFDFTYRKALQIFGTDCVRDLLDKEAHVKLGMQDARRYKRAIFDDVRFENEAEAIREAGGLIVHMTTDAEKEAHESSGHASERIDWDIKPHFHVLRVVGNNALFMCPSSSLALSQEVPITYRDIGNLLLKNCLTV